ncbi:MAG TPA: DUF1835 domain-containing protein [Steroidobacter sp.]
MSATIHLIQGLSAAGCLQQALRPKRGELLANEDVLSCGPLVPMSTDDEWARMRERYWASIPLRVEAPEGYGRCVSWDLFENAPALRDASTIVFWIGLGVAEQLFLAWAVQWLRRLGSRAELNVIQFVNVGSRNMSAWSLGLLNPDMLKQHPPSKELSPQAIDELECCWTKMMSSAPEGLLSVLSGASTHSPYFRNAARQIIERFPDHKTGLGRFDLELLKQASSHGQVLRVIGNTLAENFDADMVGDAYLFSRLLQLGDSALAHPLVKISGNPTTMRDCEVSLSEAGESVLAGRANAVELNGIDDWVLGVHLDSKLGRVWYRKDGVLMEG